jgi:hypothetical protein
MLNINNGANTQRRRKIRERGVEYAIAAYIKLRTGEDMLPGNFTAEELLQLSKLCLHPKYERWCRPLESKINEINKEIEAETGIKEYFVSKNT